MKVKLTLDVEVEEETAAYLDKEALQMGKDRDLIAAELLEKIVVDSKNESFVDYVLRMQRLPNSEKINMKDHKKIAREEMQKKYFERFELVWLSEKSIGNDVNF